MIPRLHSRGKSFKGTLEYVLHDADKQKSADRVGWTLTQNLYSRAEDAWFEMFETFKAQQQLKQEAGVDARGRKNTSPVLHYSLSWSPQEQPTREEMQGAARASIEALGLSSHEAVIVGHEDKAHPHLHIVINTVHPGTGRTAALKFSRFELSRWAEDYERTHGMFCDARVQNNEDRRILKEQRSQEALAFLEAAAGGIYSGDRAPYVPVKDQSPNRRQWLQQKAEREKIVAIVLDKLTTNASTFERRDLAKALDDQAKDAEDFKALLAHAEASPELVRLTKSGERLSTRTMVQVEADLAKLATAMQARLSHRTDGPAEMRPGQAALSQEQAEALRHIIDAPALSNVVGLAGTGKSTMLAAARVAWERAGFDVLGATISGVAAQNLQEASGIESVTIHKLLWLIENGKRELSARDVVVIDEAGMVGSRQMHKLLQAADQAKAKVVLVGDPEQLRAIQAGAAFRAVIERTGAATMSEVRRQQSRWQREATVDLAAGRTMRAVSAYEDAGRMHGFDAKAAAIDAMIANWKADQKQLPAGGTSVMFAATNATVHAINQKVRATLQSEGKLKNEKMLCALDEGIDRPRREFEIPVAIGERLMFKKNDYKLDVRNGTVGTIEGFGAQSLRIRIDGKTPRVLDVDLSLYRNFDYAYAMTIHKGQGVTVDRSHVFAERNMDRNMTYVGLSRHREAASLYWSTDVFSSRWKLEASLGRRRSKDTTLDYSDPRAAVRTTPMREPGGLSKSTSRSFTAHSRPESSRASELRSEMKAWRQNRGGDSKGFGREL
jgi:Ti-type conjugative transfer relaxase TraA